MFKITQSELAAKTTTQLSAIYHEASKGLVVTNDRLGSLQALLAAVRAEIARRGLSP